MAAARRISRKRRSSRRQTSDRYSGTRSSPFPNRPAPVAGRPCRHRRTRTPPSPLERDPLGIDKRAEFPPRGHGADPVLRALLAFPRSSCIPFPGSFDSPGALRDSMDLDRWCPFHSETHARAHDTGGLPSNVIPPAQTGQAKSTSVASVSGFHLIQAPPPTPGVKQSGLGPQQLVSAP
jgi:hypothetical protein